MLGISGEREHGQDVREENGKSQKHFKQNPSYSLVTHSYIAQFICFVVCCFVFFQNPFVVVLKIPSPIHSHHIIPLSLSIYI